MRFKPVLIAGFGLMILFTLMLLAQQSLLGQLTLSILFALVIIVELVLILIDHEFSRTHLFISLILFLSIVSLVVHLMAKATLTTFFLGGMFILAYLFAIALISLHDWRNYRVFDKMIEAMQDKRTKGRTSEVIPVERIIEEPPRVKLRQDDEGEWVEIKVRKSPKKRTKKSSRKNAK